jgi:hypothetical protein
MPKIFLSYSRGDDGEPFDPATSLVARLHSDLTAAGFDVWFDRLSMPSRALTFHQEIRDALASCDRVLLAVGPNAAASLYVRQEWQFAYFEAEKIVTPILVGGDYGDVPEELKRWHCEDFRGAREARGLWGWLRRLVRPSSYEFHLKNLIRQLREPAPKLGDLLGVPSLPPHFLSRADRLAALRDVLRADLERPVVITGRRPASASTAWEGSVNRYWRRAWRATATSAKPSLTASSGSASAPRRTSWNSSAASTPPWGVTGPFGRSTRGALSCTSSSKTRVFSSFWTTPGGAATSNGLTSSGRAAGR